MTEKDEDIAYQTSPSTSFKPIIEPAKSAMVPPDARPILSIPSAQTSFDEQPIVKEGFNYWTHLPYPVEDEATDRKSTRLNSSHSQISYAVFCLKKKTI